MFDCSVFFIQLTLPWTRGFLPYAVIGLWVSVTANEERLTAGCEKHLCARHESTNDSDSFRFVFILRRKEFCHRVEKRYALVPNATLLCCTCFNHWKHQSNINTFQYMLDIFSSCTMSMDQKLNYYYSRIPSFYFFYSISLFSFWT